MVQYTHKSSNPKCGAQRRGKNFKDHSLTPDSELFWSQRSAVFAEEARDPHSFYARRAALVAEIASQRARGIRTLDLGCGAGQLCLDLAKRGFDVHGVDLSQAQVAMAVEGLQNLVGDAERRFRVGDAAAVPFAGKFDVITAIGLLPYVENHADFIAGAVARLVPGGLLLISCTNRASLFTLLALARHLRGFKPSRAWFDVFRNLARTGVWSGGFVDPGAAGQCRSAKALDRLCVRLGLAPQDALDLYNVDWCGLDRSPRERGPIGRAAARYCSWCHVGIYRLTDDARGTEA